MNAFKNKNLIEVPIWNLTYLGNVNILYNIFVQVY